jgi:hypothetical protein
MRTIKNAWGFVCSNWGEFGFTFIGFLVMAGRWLDPYRLATHPAVNPQTALMDGDAHWLFAAGACAFLFLLAKSINTHRDRIYNPLLISRYWDAFEKMEGDKRPAAAQACLDFLKVGDWAKVSEPERIEDVLDFFEDLGFNLKNKQLSIELIHHNFDHWIRLYLQVCDAYIAEYRKKEPARWEYCDLLRRKTDQIEAEKSNKIAAQLTLTKQDMIKYLTEEAAYAESKT